MSLKISERIVVTGLGLLFCMKADVALALGRRLGEVFRVADEAARLQYAGEGDDARLTHAPVLLSSRQTVRRCGR